MYDPSKVLQDVDAHVVPILLLAGASMIANYVWFIAAFRIARKEQTYSLPLFCTFYWFAHDSSYLVRYNKWFHEYGHWFTKLWWVAFIPVAAIEIAFIVQSTPLARRELLPNVGHRAFAGLMALGTITGVFVWSGLKYILDDDLYLLGFGITVVSYPIFGLSLLIRRKSARGQTVGMWIGYLVTAVGWFTVSTLYFGPAFRSWQWIGLGTISVIGGLAITLLVHRLRTADKDPMADPSRTVAVTA